MKKHERILFIFREWSQEYKVITGVDPLGGTEVITIFLTGTNKNKYKLLLRLRLTIPLRIIHNYKYIETKKTIFCAESGILL